MYNVIIVDDEPVIRFGLQASVNWDENLHLIGSFPNGEEALKAMKIQKIDLLITDIKMPVMDGLTLMKKALEQFPAIKVILVSSYNDFEYVREGLKLGAIDYVLKPTLEPEEFAKLIQKCVKIIEDEQAIESKIQLVDQTKLLKERKNLEQAVKRVILEDTKIQNVYKDFEWLKGPLLIITMTLNHIEKIEEQFGFLYKSMLLDDIQEFFYHTKYKGICFPISENEILFLMHTELTPSLTLDRLKDELERETNLNFSYGYELINDISLVKKGFEKSRLACSRRFFCEEETIFHYDSFYKDNNIEIKPFKLEEFYGLLLPYEKNKLMFFLEERVTEWKKEYMEPNDIKREACEIMSHLFTKKISLELLLENCEELKKTGTLTQLIEVLFQQIEQYEYLMKQKQALPHGDHQFMEKAIEFIHENYTEELTLQIVSNHIHISRNYFSILFKQFVGKNFIDYVIELRIKKAKELLQDTSLKVYQVAKQSGFKDVKYFSKMFKKSIGYTPGDYRTIHQRQ